MNKNGMGVGSALIVLVFAVLCLAIFTLITYTQAQNDMALVQAEKRLVTGYYAADAQAEQIVAQLLLVADRPVRSYYEVSAQTEPAQDELLADMTINDISITSQWDDSVGAQVATFSCPVTTDMELYVEVALYGQEDYDVLSWRMRSTGSWAADDSIQVWQGVEIDDGLNLSTNGGASLWGGQ